MAALANEPAKLLSNEPAGPRLFIMELESPYIARTILPGQFVHMRANQMADHILRRPFSVYRTDPEAGRVAILYQVVGYGTDYLTGLSPEADPAIELVGPVGRPWGARTGGERGDARRVLLVAGGVGAAPLYLLAQQLVERGAKVDLVMGAQTESALATLSDYRERLGIGVECATDDGTYGERGFCTGLASKRLDAGCAFDGAPYDLVCCCGPEPLMRIVSGMAAEAGVACQVSMERRMACGVGACLSCVVDTSAGKRRACVDGPVFDADEVVWR
ncbi:MAG: dihydroorotate dehydrogenase electron transfer subunit [Berryella intestinalis]|uniref:dihydroorotate dehydrogenase electron transfer subunit n=1 Tax=Berryella intestinalis TaxID=1531429 RepID=UPI002A54034D|nr:dihydroorotate dehydrogenase electron transfer subunit [Berryella intestinalis]MDD7368676.1 dihydroorotate dehydrogenase electron transfer subunit [Berryella intestinalis]MDY3129189.1 dihydroorotate dehydrogenase electron transfer subunit [Berryella intestinalis]